ncbi:HU family DNA-binding protein [Spiroplasma endosymbiont of Othius punctulatus]|uniref:HU family DNA-binding protein n=1 Tax=Spiroplasma endosymbiont of Othius punctulatus TaxID=3066289 RepID=UPI0030D1FEF0
MFNRKEKKTNNKKPMEGLVSDGTAPMAHVGKMPDRPKVLEGGARKQDLIMQSRQMGAVKRGDGSKDALPDGVKQSVENKERIMLEVNRGEKNDPNSLRDRYSIDTKPVTRQDAAKLKTIRLRKFGIESDVRLSRIEDSTLGIVVDKKEIVDRVMDKVTDVDVKVVNKVLNLIFAEIKLTLISGTEVQLSGFGNFTLNRIKAHKGINPKTGESIEIPNITLVKFKAAKALKDAIEKQEAIEKKKLKK